MFSCIVSNPALSLIHLDKEVSFLIPHNTFPLFQSGSVLYTTHQVLIIVFGGCKACMQLLGHGNPSDKAPHVNPNGGLEMLN